MLFHLNIVSEDLVICHRVIFVFKFRQYTHMTIGRKKVNIQKPLKILKLQGVVIKLTEIVC